MAAILPTSTGSPTDAPRISPLVLALVISLVAATVAVIGNVVMGLGEAPLVIGTLLVASLAGWANVSGPRAHRH